MFLTATLAACKGLAVSALGVPFPAKTPAGSVAMARMAFGCQKSLDLGFREEESSTPATGVAASAFVEFLDSTSEATHRFSTEASPSLLAAPQT